LTGIGEEFINKNCPLREEERAIFLIQNLAFDL
jgi:hypothetical protein